MVTFDSTTTKLGPTCACLSVLLFNANLRHGVMLHTLHILVKLVILSTHKLQEMAVFAFYSVHSVLNFGVWE